MNIGPSGRVKLAPKTKTDTSAKEVIVVLSNNCLSADGNYIEQAR